MWSCFRRLCAGRKTELCEYTVAPRERMIEARRTLIRKLSAKFGNKQSSLSHVATDT